MTEERELWDQVIHGDCLAVMKTFPSDYFHALVCDPPSGIHFMSKNWDSDKGGRDAWIAWMAEVMKEAFRCCRPGSHALIWALPRTSHWTGMALEDAGWQVRNCLTHLFGSGFPKSLNLGNGRGTDLKPACEFWWLCRKPLSEKNIAANVLTWGCGGINIDACRVGTAQDMNPHDFDDSKRTAPKFSGILNGGKEGQYCSRTGTVPNGRFPSNLLLSHDPRCIARGTKRVRANGPSPLPDEHKDDVYGLGLHVNSSISYRDEHGLEEVPAFDCVEGCPVRVLGEQSGERKSGGPITSNGIGMFHDKKTPATVDRYDKEGSAARYFQQFHDPLSSLDVPFHYFSKSSRRERSLGCENLPERVAPIHNTEGRDLTNPKNSMSAGERERVLRGETPTLPRANHHPTVKPISLMRWLCRLITPPGGIVLDPFLGSGSTAVAAIQEGFSFIGIEQEQEYVTIARARIAHAQHEARREEREGQEWECVEECPIKVLDAQSGIRKSGARKGPREHTSDTGWGKGTIQLGGACEASEGGASRYFQQLAPDPLCQPAKPPTRKPKRPTPSPCTAVSLWETGEEEEVS